ncbi:carbohydrate kinase family protein [candidate division KSB1 bacterium]|nr:carbohydrate kinase family protein [candidate division KSB1 bacterium]
MKIALIGTFILDEIQILDGTISRSLGGITYALSALANLIDPKVTIYPIANVGHDAYHEIKKFTDRYPNIDTTGIQVSAAPNTRVKLRYYSKHERDEFLTFPAAPINPKQITKAGKFDLVLLNYITGFEMSIETHRLVQQLAPMTYMDYHSLCLGIDENGKRFRRKPENWKQWLEGISILQLNEHEATLLNKGIADFEQFAHKAMIGSVKIINVTLGENGSLLFTKQNNGRIRTFTIQSVPYPDVVDVTGCGDAFAGGYISQILNGGSPEAAAAFANKVAGFKSTLQGISMMSKLGKFRAHNMEKTIK